MKPYILLVAPTSLVLKATAWLVTPVHTTATVYAFQKKLLDNIKVTHPSLTKGHYYSDGCAGQYKNRYNIINQCHHKGLLAEWHFFATSHGKTACDGIGGTAKRLTLNASLQGPVSNPYPSRYVCILQGQHTWCAFSLCK